eukprot:TRINITY_DN21065_c0_g1_i1.p1 TRINITY_DN21065_c0_g1~~TRINITY_DN21065_c0_g1_i1.p1  ORF type:complete len:101 (-),score=32.97 TRINITY_DN21065_c0_g1_i1:41-343(-)
MLSSIKEKDLALEKLALEQDKLLTNFKKSKNDLDKEIDNKENELKAIKLTVQDQRNKFTEEKSKLERTISLNLDNSKKDRMAMEKKLNDAVTKIESEKEK